MSSAHGVTLGGGFVRAWARFAACLLACIGSLQWAGAAEEKRDAEAEKAAAIEKEVTQGALRIVKEDGAVVECPLKHTDVQAEISGFVARVKVTQTFHNPMEEKIEAVYVFPLPHEAAVDEMTMALGERKIVGLIKRRQEARQIYEQALAAGQTAALLEQERPNIFTQSVGNIEPGQEINIEISYVDVLRYDMGTYEFAFPMVVGPRYIPGAPISTPGGTPRELEGKVSPPVADTTRVPDASRISPPVLKPGLRNGHDISLAVKLDAGVPIQGLKAANHQAEIERDGERKATIKLAAADSLPNKDFVLRYEVVGDKPEMAMLAHTGDYTDAGRLGNGYFMLMIQPQEDERLKKSPPREIVFLVDVSGSMGGEPTAKTIETMQSMLKLCREQDTVQVITFASQAHKLFERPVPVNDDNIKRALRFTEGLQGAGGTEMLKGVQMAIDEPIDKERLRIIVMLTDGYIGNEAEIIEHVGKRCGDQIRFWCIGVGASPNMFLVDGVARQGGGMGKHLAPKDDAAALSQEVMTRIQRAQLAKIKIDWGSLEVAETYPARIPELWAGRPVILLGRYKSGGDAKITVRGNVEGEDVQWPLAVSLPQKEEGHNALAKVWARRKVEDLMQQTYYQGSPAVEEEVTAIALDYKLMSQYTSFVAVDEREAEAGEAPVQPPRRMLVPAPLPEGTRWEGFFGGEADAPGLVDAFRSKSRLGEAVADYSQPLALGLEPRRRQMPALEQLQRLPRSYRSATTRGLAPAPGRPNVRFAAPAQQQGQQLRFYNAQAAFGRGLRATEGRGDRSAGGFGGRSYGIEGGAILRESLALDRAQVAEVVRDVQDGEAADYDYTAASLAEQAQPLSNAAQQALAAGQQAREKEQLAAARASLERAYFLDNAAANVGRSSGQIAASALAAIEEIRNAQIRAWAKQASGLDKKLDLVLRDQSLAEALEAVAQASGLRARLIAGSVDDASRIVSQDNLHVAYLDLRGATAAQALDWLLLPARLTWRLEDGRIVAASQRRLEGSSAWVYDVSEIALPDAKELLQLANHPEATEKAKVAAESFLKTIREHLPGAEELSVVWHAPGELLVFGDAKTHAAVDALIARLADPKAKFAGAAAELHKTTSKRAADRKEGVAKRQAAAHKRSVAAAHDRFGWQLLAAAAEGRLDPEALTHLQIAWRDPATAEMLKGDAAAIPLRSLWILHEAARAISSDDAELAELVDSASSQSQSAADAALAALEKAPDDARAFSQTLFAALARQDDREFARKAILLLTKDRGEDSPLAFPAALAKALLSDSRDVDAGPIVTRIEAGAQGETLVALAALACHRLGGEAWTAFRSASREIVGEQPLSGHVVVLVSRLSGSPLAAARRE